MTNSRDKTRKHKMVYFHSVNTARFCVDPFFYARVKIYCKVMQIITHYNIGIQLKFTYFLIHRYQNMKCLIFPVGDPTNSIYFNGFKRNAKKCLLNSYNIIASYSASEHHLKLIIQQSLTKSKLKAHFRLFEWL